MIRVTLRFGCAMRLAFVGDAEHDCLLGGRGEPAWLEDRFLPAMLLLRPWRGVVAAILLGERTDRSSR